MANISTADIFDAHVETGRIQSCEVQFRQYGGHNAFAGPIRTVKCFEDNALVKKVLSEPGNGAVLVIDGGGSLRSALLGDLIGDMAVKNGWTGVIIWGAVRDTLALKPLDVGIKAIGSNPRRSRKDGMGHVDMPVTFGSATFTPGGWVYSDDDGILSAEGELI
jgi:regulator of ribonuclease activity A